MNSRKEITQDIYLADIKQYVVVKCKDGKHRILVEVSLDVEYLGIEIIGFYETEYQAAYVCDKKNKEVKE